MWKWLHLGVVVFLLLATSALVISRLGWNPALQYLGDEVGPKSVLRARYLTDGIFGFTGWLDLNLGSIDWLGFRDESQPIFQDSFEIDIPGFHLSHKRTRNTNLPFDVIKLEIDYLVFAIFTAIYPAIFFIRTYRRRRVHRQALQPCGQCGYDLQGNESGVCPECGEAVEVTA